MIREVMKAPHEILLPDQHTYPLLVSTKLDGNRCFILNGKFYTRSMKPQPNQNLRRHLAGIAEWTERTGCAVDGELWSTEMEFNELQSVVRSHHVVIPDHVRFYAFDLLTADGNLSLPFRERDYFLKDMYEYHGWLHTHYLSHFYIETPEALTWMYDTALRSGHEGLILRNPKGRYKAGRATVREGLMFKMKPFETIDAKVIGWSEQESIRMDAPRHLNEMGFLARTSRAEHLFKAGTMGSLQVMDETGRVFSIGWGPGWNHAKRQMLWNDRHNLLNQWVEVRAFPHGEKDLPRQPQLLRFREPK